MTMELKQKAFNYCIDLINEKIKTMQNELKDLSDGARNDSKSSAGDKHETAQSMMQLEQEKINRQLQEVMEQRDVVEKIDITINSSHIIIGSLIKTNSMYLFLSVALGRIIIDNNPIVFLSPQSPLGKKLMGLKINDSIDMNGVVYKIESIF